MEVLMTLLTADSAARLWHDSRTGGGQIHRCLVRPGAGRGGAPGAEADQHHGDGPGHGDGRHGGDGYATVAVAGAVTASTAEVRTGEEARVWVEAGARGRTSLSTATVLKS